jgi:hypothetical protein
MMTIATRILAASAAGVLSGVLGIGMIFASPAPNNGDLNCTHVHCVAPDFRA